MLVSQKIFRQEEIDKPKKRIKQEKPKLIIDLSNCKYEIGKKNNKHLNNCYSEKMC